MRKAIPIPESYWVVDNRLMAGQYPGDLAETAAVEKLRRITAVGIDCFVDLTVLGELKPYAHHLKALGAHNGRVIHHHRMPIRDLDVPNHKEMVAILDLIDSKLYEGNVVYVHCWGGVGRTGTVIGCYLARHGTATGNQALALIEELRQHTPKAQAGLKSPETRLQTEMVKTWRIGN